MADKVMDLNGECIMECRAMLEERLGIRAAFFDDCVAVVIQRVETAEAKRDRLRETAMRLEQEAARLREALEAERRFYEQIPAMSPGFYRNYRGEINKAFARIDAALAATPAATSPPVAAVIARGLTDPENQPNQWTGKDYPAMEHQLEVVSLLLNEALGALWGFAANTNLGPDKLARTGLPDRIRAALAAAPAAAPTPDARDVCECGHGRLAHGPLCFLGCPCPGFRPKRGEGQG